MDKPKNILLVQLFSNGDCMYATVVARQIKTDFPGCLLTWAIAGFCKNIIDNNPYVDNVLVTNEVAKNDVAAFRKYKKKVLAEKERGLWNEVFVTTNMDTNLALYDGTIRGMILRAYPNKITVPLQPVVCLTQQEKARTAAFAKQHNLFAFKNVILWEYAPQSGQTTLNFDLVMSTAVRIAAQPDTCVILTSGNKFTGTDKIIDASVLTVRENAALTHYCTLLIGCSSGITWLTTSSDAKFLPMIQLLNDQADFINAPSVDFKRYAIPHSGLIEMKDFNGDKIYDCVTEVVGHGFSSANKYNQQLSLQFKTTKKIVYNLLVYREFKAIRKHFLIMKSVYGLNPFFLKAFTEGLALSPVTFSRNFYRKTLRRK